MTTFDRYKWFGERTPEQLDRERYLASKQLATAVNTALAAEQPLLITGEPGTGKTALAGSIADQLGIELYPFSTRSDHQARDLLYSFDHLRRFYDAQARAPGGSDGIDRLSKYVSFRGLGLAIQSGRECVVLIDEIDKAPRDLPNDLLDVVERLRFRVDETDEVHETKHPPILVITSNNERHLPDPFLRRCVFHHLAFPDTEMLQQILRTHFGDALPAWLAGKAIARFEELRGNPLEKLPATSELIRWTRVLLRAGVSEDLLNGPVGELPYLGALLKTHADHISVQK